MKNLKRALEIFNLIEEKGGIEEFGKKKKIALLTELVEQFDEKQTTIDGDGDGAYLIIHVEEDGDGAIVIDSYAEYHDDEEIIEKAYGLREEDFKTTFEDYVAQMTGATKIINLTPHDINIVNTELYELQKFKSEGVVRVTTKSVQTGSVGNVPLFSTQYGEVTGLPAQKPNTYYIVSMLVKQACPDRKDLLIPSQLQRGENGQPVGCLGLE